MTAQKAAFARVQHECPFCGGPVELDDDQLIAPCRHCGARLRVLASEGIPTYTLRASLPRHEAVFHLERELKQREETLPTRYGECYEVWLPFDRVTGMVFEYRMDRTIHQEYTEEGQTRESLRDTPMSRLVAKDVSFASTKADLGIDSLGIRSTVLALAPLTEAETRDRMFAEAGLSRVQAVERYGRAVDSVAAYAGEKARTHFVKTLPPEFSRIYLPVWVINFQSHAAESHAVMDCVARRVVRIASGALPSRTIASKTPPEHGTFTLVAHRCSHCGIDLPQQRRGEVFVCGNCSRLYFAQGREYLEQEVVVESGSASGATVFPFWEVRFRAGGEPERLLRRFGIVGNRLHLPAFTGSHPRSAGRLIVALAHDNQIRFDKVGERAYHWVPAEVTRSEAERLVLSLLLCGTDYLNEFDLEAWWETEIEFDSARLVWLAFTREGYFYRQAGSGAAIEAAAVDSG